MGVGATIAKEPVSGAYRVFQVLFGVTALAAAVLVWVFPGVAIATLVVLLAVGLVGLGLLSIATGAPRHVPGWIRGVRIGLGVLDFVLAALVILDPILGVAFLVTLLAFALILDGVGHIAGAVRRGRPGWFRGLSSAVGMLNLILSFIVLLFPGLGLLFLVVLLSVALAFSGAVGLTDGILGVRWTVVAQPTTKPTQ